MKYFSKAVLVSITTLALFGAQDLWAASANGTATASVRAAIAIAAASNLAFGEGTQGGVASAVGAGTSENAGNGSFSITGEPSTAYSVTLPADSVVTMTTGDGVGATKQIAVDSFEYYSTAAASASSASLNGSGADTLLVGGSRAALAANQVTGSYTGSYSVTVAY